jgi:hypothetical protein
MARGVLEVLSCGVLLAGVGLVSLGCGGGISPGDYKLYRVAVAATPDKSAGCYPDSKIPASEKASSDDARVSQTWEIYAGTKDPASFFLEIDGGKETLEGTLSDKTYGFETTKVDVAFQNPDGTGWKYSKTDHVAIDVTVDGKTISGSITQTHSEKCSGNSGCPTIPPTCSQTADYTGTEVDNVQLKHDM